jgi:putative membrane protein
MSRRVLRHSPLLIAAVVFGLVSAGSFALASDRGEHHPGDHHKRFSAWDEQWLMMSIEGDLFEIQGGKIAQEKGSIPEVRDLGARLVADHTKSLHEATQVAQELGIEVPSEPSPSQRWELRVVSSFSGNTFDRWYSDLEVQDHKQDIQEAQDEVDKGRNHDIRELAEDDIPVLQEHLKLAQATLEAAGGPVTP